MKSNGYIKLYRDLLQHPVFTDPYLLKLFNYCLLKASHKERDYVMDNTVVKLIPGEFIWGRKSAADDLNHKTPPKYKISEKSWENKLKVLEKLDIVTRKTTNKFTVINVVNWGFYQSDDNQSYQQNDQQATNSLPAGYQQLATNKNVKNVEHVKNVVVSDSDNAFKTILNLYQENIEMTPSQITLQKIGQDFDDYGHELMKHAIEKSALANNHDYRFIAYLLKDWNKNQLRTVEAVKQYEAQREAKKNYSNNRGQTATASPYTNMEFIEPDENDLPF